MKKDIYRYLLPLFAAVGTLILAMTHPPEVVESAPPVVMTLPASIANWQGEAIAYCQNEACMHECTAHLGMLPDRCPDCGGKLDSVSLPEHNLLPRDSQFVRMLYRRSANETAFVSVVLTGTERSSIHRPEWCLPAQGLQIRKTTYSEISTPHGLMKIASLNVSRDGVARTEAKLLYWFSSANGHHTATHTGRLFLMGTDSLFHGKQYRWAYVSILIRSPHEQSLDAISQTFAEKLCQRLYVTNR